MRKFLFLIWISLYVFNGKAQVNLVPNPSFEIHNNCPLGTSQINEAAPWFQPSLGTPDLFDSCDVSEFVGVPQNFIGYQNARTGRAYAGLFVAYPGLASPSFREYIEVKLSDSLLPGQRYYVTFYVSLSDSSHYATDDIAVLFSTDSAKSDTSYLLYWTPQITNLSGSYLNNKFIWTQISGQYIAVGGEKYLTIGNFKSNTNTDTVKVSGGGSISSDFYNSYYYIDDVCISTDSMTCFQPVSIDERSKGLCSIFPNPTSDKLILKSNMPGVLIMYNSRGHKVIEREFLIGNNLVYVETLENGLYYVEIKTRDKISRTRIIINH